MPRRWFQFHLSTALILTVVAGVVLGLNMTRRAVVNPAAPGLKIGMGDSAVPVTAYFMRTYLGWPFEWERENVDRSYAQLMLNVGSALCILMLTALVCELRVRWKLRALAPGERDRTVRVLGLDVKFLAWLSATTVAGVIVLSHLMVRVVGPLVCRGWPLPTEVYLRADAVIDRGAIEAWRWTQANSGWCALLNGAAAVLGFVVIFGAVRWYIWRQHKTRGYQP